MEYTFYNKTIDQLLEWDFFTDILDSVGPWDIVPTPNKIVLKSQKIPIQSDHDVKSFKIGDWETEFKVNKDLPHLDDLLRPTVSQGWTLTFKNVSLCITPATFVPKNMLFSEWGDDGSEVELTKYGKLAWKINELLRDGEVVPDDMKKELIFYAIHNNYSITPHLLNRYGLSPVLAHDIYNVALGVADAMVQKKS